MPRIGSSTINLDDLTLLINRDSPFDFIGNRGRPGTTGATGATGTTGSTGSAGYNVVFVSKSSNNAVIVTTSDGRQLSASGIQGPAGNVGGPLQNYFIENFESASSPTTQFLFFKEKIGITSYFKTLAVTGDIGYTAGSAGITLTGLTLGRSSLGVNTLLYFSDAISPAKSLNYQGFLIAGYTAQQQGITTESVLLAKIATFKEYKTIAGLTNINVQIGTTHGTNFFLNDETEHAGLVLSPKTVNTSIDRLKIYNSPSGLTAVNKKYIKFVNNLNQLEGISFVQTLTSGVTVSSSARLYGSCCFCDEAGAGDTADTNICLDFAHRDYCNSVNGVFSSMSCSERRNDSIYGCFYGGSCCVNGECIDNISEQECKKFNGFFARGVNCLNYECPNLCNINPTTGERNFSCCINGRCFNIQEDKCFQFGGIFQPKPCTEVNCCEYGYYGACCKGITCYENYLPPDCAKFNGIYQGPGTVCQNTVCCSTEEALNLTNFFSKSVENNITSYDNSTELPCTLKIGDYFGGGYFAGFIGYPTPTCWNSTPAVARGELISNLEWSGERKIVNYIPVNGGYSTTHSCQCNNLPAGRYVLENDLLSRAGKAISVNVNYLSWNVNNDASSEIPYITYTNRIQELCLPQIYAKTNYCIGSPDGNRKYGYNAVSAFKTVADKIYTNGKIPRAWAIIVAPENVSGDDLSWGLSTATNGFSQENNDYGLYLWENTELTPYGTSITNGYLNTKMFDHTSGNNLIWFTPIKNGIDPLAYKKFNHTLNSYWGTNVDPTRITSDSVYYTEKYNQMWETANPQDSSIKYISNINKTNYNGYSDWYIPSIAELNIIYNNYIKINENIINSGNGEPLTGNDWYWSSTSGVVNAPAIRGNALYSSGINKNLEIVFNDTDPNKKAWKEYKTALGHNMYAQNFKTGSVNSIKRDVNYAKLRPIRMIPIYSYDIESNEQLLYSGSELFDCTNCSPSND